MVNYFPYFLTEICRIYIHFSSFNNDYTNDVFEILEPLNTDQSLVPRCSQGLQKQREHVFHTEMLLQPKSHYGALG